MLPADDFDLNLDLHDLCAAQRIAWRLHDHALVDALADAVERLERERWSEGRRLAVYAEMPGPHGPDVA